MLKLGALLPESSLGLPPNVKGRSRGFIRLNIDKLNWKTTAKLPFAGKSVIVKLIWWGESSVSNKTSSVRIICHKNEQPNEQFITYSINTSVKLFQQYITSAEPICIKFLSEISNVFIGSASVRIPGKFIQFLAENHLNPTSQHKSTYSVVNSKHKIIGDCVITIEMTITERHSPRIVPPLEIDSACSKTSITSNRSTKGESAQNCRKSIGKSNAVKLVPAPTMKDVATLTKSATSLRSANALNYLTGRQMTKQQELDALKELKVVSPTNSFIESLSENILKVPKSSVDSGRRVEENFCSKIDSIKIYIDCLTLSKAGIREVNASLKDSSSYNSNDVTFIVECKLNANTENAQNSRRSKWKYEFDVIRVTSGCQTDFTSKIEFNKEAIRSITIPMVDTPTNVITFKIWFREIGQKQSQTFGTAVIRIRDIIESHHFTYMGKCLVTTGDILLGSLVVRLELGTRGLHFGREFLEAISFNKENRIDHDLDLLTNITQRRKNVQLNCEKFTTKCCNHDSNEQSNDSTKQSNDNEQTSAGQSSDADNQRQASDTHANENTNNHRVSVENPFKDNTTEHSTLLHGLIYIGSIFHFKSQSSTVDESKLDTFMMIRAFWRDTSITTGVCEQNVFNFLELFPVMCNDEFLDRTRNKFLDLEMWQRQSEQHSPEQLVGTTSLPLHQFYVAFRDATVLNHLSKVKLPVISIDGWTTIVSPITSTPIAKLQVLLAIGTEEQLTYLKTSRGLAIGSLSEADIFKNKLPIPNPPQFVVPPPPPPILNAGTQTNFQVEQRNDDNHTTGIGKPQSSFSNEMVTHDRQATLASMLNNFIDNLAARLPPERNQNLIETITDEKATKCSLNNVQNVPNIRRTSDLLDTLQRALMCPVPSNAVQSLPVTATTSNISEDLELDDNQSIAQRPSNENIDDSLRNSQPETAFVIAPAKPHFQVLIEIENALHISKIFVRINKKCGKQRGGSGNSIGGISTGCITSRCNSSSNKSLPQSTTVYRGVTEIEPSTYVTFEATGPPTSIVQSHEGPVYTTNVIEKSCNPQWNKRFEVFLPVDLMTCDEKRFIVKVWRKASTDLPQARLLPNPIEDSLIGFTAIDLSVLLLGMPTISGWYNIVDFSGRIHGQIKVNIQPMEDLNVYRQPIDVPSQQTSSNQSNADAPSLSIAQNPMLPLSIDTNLDINRGDTILSRTLKRKFTELEEITQRLKARLFDVTGDENIDPDDEFENDLNTNPEEDENSDDYAQIVQENGNFDWFRRATAAPSTSVETFLENRADEFEYAAMSSNDKNRSHTVTQTERNVSGCSQYTAQPQATEINWQQILQTHEIDEIINPQILPRLMNPSIPVSTSEDSTPRLIQQTQMIQTDNNDELSITDDSATINNSNTTISDQDRIRLISNALQNTNIDEQMERHAPEGHVSTVKEK